MEDPPTGLDTTFLGAGGSKLGELTLSDGRLGSSGKLREELLATSGTAEVTVGEFDAFALVGLQFTVNCCARIFHASHPRCAGERVNDTDERFVDSRSSLLAATSTSLRRSIAMSLGRKLRAATAAPILVVPQPGLSERVLRADLESCKSWQELHAHDCEKQIRSIFEETCAALANDIQIVGPPGETIVEEILTASRYDCCDPHRPPTHLELSHMNIDYGRLVRRDLIDALAH